MANKRLIGALLDPTADPRRPGPDRHQVRPLDRAKTFKTVKKHRGHEMQPALARGFSSGVPSSPAPSRERDLPRSGPFRGRRPCRRNLSMHAVCFRPGRSVLVSRRRSKVLTAGERAPPPERRNAMEVYRYVRRSMSGRAAGAAARIRAGRLPGVATAGLKRAFTAVHPCSIRDDHRQSGDRDGAIR